MEIVNIDNITKIYDELTEQPIVSLKDISLTIYKGDFLCVMGPSGSGKSTFVKCISSIDMPNKGSVEIYNKSVVSMSEDDIGELRNKKIGFIFQDYQLLDYLTIGENIALPLTMAGKNYKEILETTKIQSKKFGISNILYKYPNECSGGQKQRAAIVRALINDPDIIIADEPTGNLDSQNTREILKILYDMNIGGKTIIMVTHDPFVASYSSRLIYIQDGMIIHQFERNKFNEKKDYVKKIIEITSREVILD